MFRRSPGVVFLVVFAALLVSAGCGGRTLGGYGNNNTVTPPDGGTLPDAATYPDGGTGVCESDQYELLHPVRVDSMYLLQSWPVSEGQTTRVAVVVPISGCQRLAQVDVRMEPSQRAIYVTAWVWEITGPLVDCPDMLMFVEEILAFPSLEIGLWQVIEATSGLPGAELAFEVSPCALDADCFCENTPPGGGGYGTECDYNCECDAFLECLPHLGNGGPFSICAASCSVDADCGPGERCAFTDDGPWAVCEPVPGVDQCPAGGCPPGFDCLQDLNGSSWCQASFNMDDEGIPCSCPADCPTGLTCIDFGGDAAPSCHAPCRGDRDCPGGLCGDDMPDTAPLCYLMWM